MIVLLALLIIYGHIILLRKVTNTKPFENTSKKIQQEMNSEWFAITEWLVKVDQIEQPEKGAVIEEIRDSAVHFYTIYEHKKAKERYK